MLHVWVAISVFSIYTAGIFGQLACILALLFKCGVLRENSSLLLVFSLAACDLLNCAAGAVGCAQALLPRLAAHEDALVGALFNFCWFCFSCHLIAMALHRLLGVFYPAHFLHYATARNSWRLVAFIWAVSIAYSLARQLVCCPVVWDRQLILSHYQFVNGSANVMLYPDTGVTILGACVPTVAYVAIALRLSYRVRLLARQQATSSIDVWLCWQFFIILLAYLNLNMCWYILPLVAAEHWYLHAISYALAINYSVNPLIYWIFNGTLRRGLQELLWARVLSAPDDSLYDIIPSGSAIQTTRL